MILFGLGPAVVVVVVVLDEDRGRDFRGEVDDPAIKSEQNEQENTSY